MRPSLQGILIVYGIMALAVASWAVVIWWNY